MTDDPTYCCDAPDCQVPVVLSALVRVGREHWCRSCYERLHPPDKVEAPYDFAFGAPEDAFTAPIEQVDAELREMGIDPEEVERRVRERLSELGIDLPNAGRSTHRADGNKLAKGTTVFEDWPGGGDYE